MVLSTQSIHQIPNKGLEVYIVNSEKKEGEVLRPHQASLHYSTWLGGSQNPTSLAIFKSSDDGQRKSAIIHLADSDWTLAITGDIENGNTNIKVNGSKDFNIHVREDDIEFECLKGDWSRNEGSIKNYNFAFK
ncbi:uncharacterized protein BO96DRAFT_415536 [Aspergillus niger CBS 101883]|uniref:Uncharacterized protein n=1 Tax=Aspergillus niger ATCC 13496 TaxID=1353008 RepID=A0A370BUQ3_ASPNG|nr:uncharacterized protein BO96DRAFT_415536 [Aspergillus niger CBS 101883]PYH52423.1 hypothetical protein BO96DRAFT_415536 [Aspergillus niger CBS 101883]RDH19257.1 hypothetical protein M747DRAFT_296469 [Aspergillus niger ATCC 13496]